MNDSAAHLTQMFLEAYEAYADALYRFCLLRIGGAEEAADMVQEIFMKTWDYMQAGREIGNMRAFLYTSAGHLVIDRYRRRKPEDSLDRLEEETGFDAPTDETERTIDQIDGTFVLSLLSELPETYAEALALRYIEGLSLSEMAELLGQSENTLAVRVHRGLEKLRLLWNAEKLQENT